MLSPSTVPTAHDERILDPVPTTAELLRSPRWHLAYTLEERLSAWRAVAPSSDESPDDSPNDSSPLAAQRLERWRTQSPFPQDGLWQRRLDSAATTEDEMLAMLAESPEALAGRMPQPDYLQELANAYGSGARTPEFPWPPQAQLDRCRFIPFIEPLIWLAWGQLEIEAEALVRSHPDAPFDASIARRLTVHLPDAFSHVLNRTMLVEMHVLKLEEALEGETPEARFENFLERLRDQRYALEILERFPVLAREVVRRIAQWQNACAELLRHLATDAGLLRNHFFQGKKPGKLQEIAGAMSDSHRDGRSVFLLAFDSGCELVYKPKSMRLEEIFQDLLGWINDHGFEPGFQPVGVLDRGDYGWMETVHTAPCLDRDALCRFFVRQGGYLALLYALEGTDFHHENLLAAGEHPILIDLETLFQPWLTGKDLRNIAAKPGAPLRATVLRPNLLPERWWGDQNTPGVDLSGLTAQEGQLTPRPMLASTDGGLDTMRMERRRLKIPVGENRAHIAGSTASVLDFLPEFEQGFRHVYQLLSEHRSAFLSELERFADCEMRILFRTTASYGIVLLESFHPHVLGNALERERLFDRLWTAAVRRPFLAELAEAEMRDLHHGDIPLFLSRPGSRGAFNWRGSRYPDLFEDSGLERAERKVAQLSPADMERQLGVIRDTFKAIELGRHALPRSTYTLQPSAEPPTPEALLRAARRAADRIVARCFENEREAQWLILDYRDPNGWQVVPSGPDFYLGLAGIAFFLGYLGEATGERRYTEVARKALYAQRRQLEGDTRQVVKGLGAYNGWGSFLYTLSHLGQLWGDESLLDEAEGYARRLPELIAEDELLDLIAGTAGCLEGLAALAQARPSAELDALMLACGERLLAKAEPQPSGGLGWRMPLAGDRALAGISHGAAGIALALLKLAARTGDERFRAAALGGIEFERSLYSPVARNWPDLRSGSPEDLEELAALDQAAGRDVSKGRFMLAWCHGAPGIGLARLAGLPWLDDAAVREEIQVAVSSTLEHGFGENHCLCHGDLGNIELLIEQARESGDQALAARAGLLAGGILDDIERNGWRMGLPGNIETPGMMSGLAGIGYGLLRLARPDLPSVLTLGSFGGAGRR